MRTRCHAQNQGWITTWIAQLHEVKMIALGPFDVDTYQKVVRQATELRHNYIATVENVGETMFQLL